MPRRPRHTLAARILTRLDALAKCTAAGGASTAATSRFYLSSEHRASADLLMGWMREAGMAVSLEPSGAVRGRFDGSAASPRTLLIGAPLDTKPKASKCENAPALLMALEVLSELRRLGKSLPCSVELIGFGIDAAHRFSPDVVLPLVGSREATVARLLDSTDAAGTTLRAALEQMGCDVARFGEPMIEASEVLGYLEICAADFGAVEKGASALGIVTTIQGISRSEFVLGGEVARTAAQQAGRRDILLALAEMLFAVDTVVKSQPAASATIGRLSLLPGVSGVPAYEVRFDVDVVSAVDRARRRVMLDLDRELRSIARRRHLPLVSSEVINRTSVACDPLFIKQLSIAADGVGQAAQVLPGGIAHPALPFAGQCPVGMMLVRCRSSDGTIETEDVETAARHVMAFMQNLPSSGRLLAGAPSSR